MIVYTVKNEDGMYYVKGGLKKHTIMWTSSLQHATLYDSDVWPKRIAKYYRNGESRVVKVEIAEV